MNTLLVLKKDPECHASLGEKRWVYFPLTESVEFNTNLQNLGRGSLRSKLKWSIRLNASVGAHAQLSKDKKVGSLKWYRLAVSPVF
jgi:hypothetical protein